MSLYSLYLPSGSTGTFHDSSSPGFSDFLPGVPLYLSFDLKVARTSGAATAALLVQLNWFDASSSALAPWSTTLTIDATSEALEKFQVNPPVNAVRGTAYLKITPAASPMIHDVWIKNLRLGKTELSATRGAQAGVNLYDSNGVMLSDALIKNQAILDSIAADNVLSKTEKLNSLIPLCADLQARYTDLKARAVALGISTVNLDNARTNWTGLLGTFAPAWNDTSQDTSIYSTALSTRNQAFPSGWNPAGGATASSASPYVTLTDNDAGQFGSYSTDTIVLGTGQGLAAGMTIKKSATHTSNWVALRVTIFNTGGGPYYWDALVNPYNGAATPGGGSPPPGSTQAVEVMDLGSDWYIDNRVVNLPAGTTGGYVTIYPAISGDGDSITSFNTTGTGSAVIKGCPAVAIGDWGNLGRDQLMARLAAYGKELTALASLISQRDGTTSVIIDPPADITIYADSNGTVKAGELERDVALTASIGTQNVTTLGAWAMTPTNGITATIGAGTGIVAITGFTAAEVYIPVSFAYNGVTRDVRVHVVRKDDQQAVSGGASGGSGGSTGGTTGSVSTIGNTNGTTYNSTAASPVIQAKAGSNGRVDLSANIFFGRVSGNIGETDTAGKWLWRPVGGTFADVAAESLNDYGAQTSGGNGDPITSTAGSLRATPAVTGLTNGTTYEFMFEWRRTSGNIEAYGSNVKLTATGS